MEGRRWWCSLLFHHLLFTSTAGVAAGISRDDFPPGFVFGAGTSAYQVEGAFAEDGKKPSIWDTFTHAGKTLDKKTGDIAADQYHKYKEDVKLMHEMGLDAYRFSISWSRLIPDGRGPVNPKGLQYYNNLVNELAYYGIEAHATLYHFDLPQALEDEYGGLLSPKIVEDFTAYADVCFREFGDRVKYWITFNEPNIETIAGHDVGLFPPARCSYPFGYNCSSGDSTTEPYTSAHNILLSHASAAKLYREKYQAKQQGYIGITLLGFWFEPSTDSPQDIAAAQRAIDFHIGWFMDPLIYGTYPDIMRKTVGSRLPSLIGNASEQLKRSFDFIGFNHYSVFYVQDHPNHLDKNKRDYLKDIAVGIPDPFHLFGKNFIGLRAPKMPKTPWALQKLLHYIKVQYKNPTIFIHENGYGEFGFYNSTNSEDQKDAYRADYLRDYIESLLLSVRNGSNARGYFVWSFIDCFETTFGYTARFGLYQVDFHDKDRKRYPRLSAAWYSNFLHGSVIQGGKPGNLVSE